MKETDEAARAEEAEEASLRLILRSPPGLL